MTERRTYVCEERSDEAIYFGTIGTIGTIGTTINHINHSSTSGDNHTHDCREHVHIVDGLQTTVGNTSTLWTACGRLSGTHPHCGRLADDRRERIDIVNGLQTTVGNVSTLSTACGRPSGTYRHCQQTIVIANIRFVPKLKSVKTLLRVYSSAVKFRRDLLLKVFVVRKVPQGLHFINRML